MGVARKETYETVPERVHIIPLSLSLITAVYHTSTYFTMFCFGALKLAFTVLPTNVFLQDHQK